MKKPVKSPPALHTYAHTGNRPNTKRRTAVAALYQAGHSAREIAQIVGISFQAVLGLLQRAGIPRRPAGGNTGSHSRHRRA